VRIIALTIAVLASLWHSASAADVPPLKLTLHEAIKMCAEKNLDLRVEVYNPALFEADINRNKSIYDLLLLLSTSYSDNTVTPLGSVGGSSGEFYRLNSSISQLFWTGATATVGFNNSHTYSDPVKFWKSDLGATLTQPLLRNIGREATEVNITIARLSKFASLEHLNARLMSMVGQVRTEYFKLYSLREQLEVKKVSLELARKILGETKARVAAGVLPAMEILNAEFGAVSREKEFIDAERAVRDQVDVLRLLLQIEGQGEILTVDLPKRDQIEISEKTSIEKAMIRPDIKEQKRNLENYELQTRVYNNKLRPDLSLVASAGAVGQDSAYSRDVEKLGTFNTPYWSLGLNFSFPLGNRAAENDYRKSRLKTEQTALQIKSLEEGAAKDVKAAIRAVTSGYKQIDVADRGRAYAEERLKAFIRKNEVGLATTKDVLDVENDLVSAKNNQITAVVGYINAITQLWIVTGELLEREDVRIVEGASDQLYSNAH
jgi:outer membrane protein TolC